jgi:hypothetical protein
MDDKTMLDICLNVTGVFENGTPKYDGLTGASDGQGLSAGILQWNAGQGTLQQLLQSIAALMGWDKMQTFFRSDIHHFAVLKPAEAIQWCLDHYIAAGSTQVDPAAEVCWKNLLNQPESIAAQTQLAITTILQRAKVLAAEYVPDHTDSTRVQAFFFDTVNQSGGMQNTRGKVKPLPAGADPDITGVLDFTHNNNLKCAGMWEVVTQTDPMARLLLYYAYERSVLSNPQYVWDALSRRGAVACRRGIVHETPIDLTKLLD